MLPLIIAIIVIVLLIGLFFVTFVINKKTPVPPECKDLSDSLKCESCTEASCALNKIHTEIRKEEK